MNDGFGAGFWAMYFIFMIAFYAYFSYSLQVIARKTSTPDGWMAWIPIINIYLMCKIAGRPGWWLILFLIPLINIIIAVILWMGLAEKRGKPGWLGILMLIPIINIIIPGYLAFSD